MLWLVFASIALVTIMSARMCRSILVQLVIFCAPSAASWPVHLFPLILACPFTHSRVVSVVLACSQVVMHLKIRPCVTPIQSLASQSGANFVRPSITNLKSIVILNGWFPGMFFTAIRIDRSSPIWFICLTLGTLTTRFLGPPGLYIRRVEFCLFACFSGIFDY